MKNNLHTIKNFLWANKMLLLPLIPFVLFFSVIIFILIFQVITPNPITNNSPSPSPQPTINNSRRINPFQDRETFLVTEREGLEKQETLSDGITQYTFTSPDSNRPSLVLTKNGSFLFERTVINQNDPLTLASFTNLYGQAEKVIKNPSYYGTNSEVYIYGPLGFTLIVNPQTGLVLEQHFFLPMLSDEYLKTFGDNIK